MFHKLRIPSAAVALALVASAPPVAAQVIFGQLVAGANGNVTGLFQDTGGTATRIQTGLPASEFPALSPDARTITFASNDPAQADSLSNDLFAFDRQSGTHRKLFDNTTQTLPNGSRSFATPVFSGTSADGSVVAFGNQVSSTSDGNGNGGGSVRILEVVPANGTGAASIVEVGQGNAIDYFESEFVGVSWARSGATFITPAYVSVTSNTGRATAAAGLVLFGRNGSGQFARIGAFTTPRVTDTQSSFVVETHAFPAFSPDGKHVAFFRITHPDPFLLQPVTADLIVVDLNAQGTILATFNPGYYPLGVAWSADGGTLLFSVAPQTHSGGNYLPSGNPDTAALFTIPVAGGAIGSVAGAPNGYFPSVVAPTSVIFANGFDG